MRRIINPTYVTLDGVIENFRIGRPAATRMTAEGDRECVRRQSLRAPSAHCRDR
jgi:hypothetical protein